MVTIHPFENRLDVFYNFFSDLMTASAGLLVLRRTCTHQEKYVIFTNIIYNTKRVVNDHNINVMMNKLKETNWNEILASEDVNYMYDTFTAKLKNIYNTTCPVTVTKQKLRKKPDKP